jgi:uncharacterized membrane protein
MKEKQMKIYRAIMAAILAVAISIGVMEGNAFIPIFALLGSMMFIIRMRRKVTDIMVDERIVQIRQKSSRMSISIFAIGAATVSIAFFALSKSNPALYLPSQTLAYSVWALLMLDLFFYYYYNHKG